MKIKNIILLASLVLTACGGKKSEAPVPVPGKAALSLPAENAACTSGAVISATQSSVTFTWNASSNTDVYELDIKSLLDNTLLTRSTSSTQAAVTLLRNTPYAWYIVSKSNKTSATGKSDTWKFYNSGPGNVSYAPFPAEIISPGFGEQLSAASSMIGLAWKGGSVDNDIVGYDVYFGPTDAPLLYKSNVTDASLNSVPVASGNTYYWRIVSRDAHGNTSDSGLYQFSVK